MDSFSERIKDIQPCFIVYGGTLSGVSVFVVIIVAFKFSSFGKNSSNKDIRGVMSVSTVRWGGCNTSDIARVE